MCGCCGWVKEDFCEMWKALETHKTTLPWKIKAPEHGHSTKTLQPVCTDVGIIIAKTLFFFLIYQWKGQIWVLLKNQTNVFIGNKKFSI